jgi:hypothetical protein
MPDDKGYTVSCVISGFHCEVEETCALVSYYAVSSGNFLPNFEERHSMREEILTGAVARHRRKCSL